VAKRLRILGCLCAGIQHHGYLGRPERRLGDGASQDVRCRSHVDRVERSAHIQRQNPTSARRAGLLGHALDGIACARDNQLAGRIQVGEFDRAAVMRGGFARGAQRRLVQADHRGHGPVHALARRGHRVCARAHQAQRILRRQHAGRHVRRELAHAVTRGGLSPKPDALTQHGQRGEAGGNHCRLGNVGFRQAIERSLGAQPAHW
jgi:hypothetical protein